MSFPKAKIHRFNDDTSCAPPPGTYDPKLLSKVKGVVMDKGERFKQPLPTTPLGPASSVESLDAVSTSSAPAFRTPHSTLLKKKLVQGGGVAPSTPSGGASTNSFQAQSESKFKKKLNYTFKSDSEQKLIEQIDELARVHTLQLLEKNQEISSLHGEMERLRMKVKELEARGGDGSESDLLDALKCELEQHREMLAGEKEAVENLKAKAAALEENLENSLAIVGTLERELSESRKRLAEVEAKCCSLESELEESRQRHRLEVREMSAEHESNMNTLGNEVDILMEELQIGFQHRLESVVEEVTERMAALGAIVAESQGVVSRLQQEVDKRFNDLEKALSACRNWNENLFKDYTAEIEECGVQKAATLEQSMKIVDVEEELDRMKTRCRNYGIVHTEATRTVEVLSQRLYESETDVERLNDAQENMRAKCTLLETRIRTLLQEDQAMRANLEEMKEALVGDVQRIESQLLAKVDAYRRIAQEEMERLKSSLQEKATDLEKCRTEADERVATERALYLALSEEYDAARTCLETQSGQVRGLAEELDLSRGMLGHALSEYEKLRMIYTQQLEMTEILQQEIEEARLLLGWSCSKEDLEETKHQLEISKEECVKITALYEEQLKNLQMKLEDSKIELEASKDNCSKTDIFYKQQLESLQKKVEELNIELELCKENNYKSTAHYEQQLESQHNKVEETKVKLEASEQHSDKVQVLYEEQLKRASSLEKEVNEVKIQMETLKNNLENARKEVEDMKGVSEESNKDYKKMRDLYEEQLEKVRSLQEEVEAKSGEVIVLSSRIRDVEEERDSFREKNSRLENLFREVLDEKCKLEEANVALEGDLEAVKQSMVSELGKVLVELESKRGLDEVNSNLMAEKWELNCRLDEVLKEVEILEKKLESAESETRLKDEAVCSNGKLLARIEALESEKTTLEAKTDDLLHQIMEKEEEMKIVVQSAVEAQDDAAALREQLVGERNKGCDLEATLENMEKDRTSLKEINKILLAKLDTMENCSGTCTFGQQMKAKLDRSKAERDGLESELALLREDYTRALGHQNNRQKIHHIGNMMKSIFQLRQEVNKLRSENAQLKLRNSRVAALSSTVVVKQEDKVDGKQIADKENPPAPPIPTVATVGRTAVNLQERVKRSDKNTTAPVKVLRQRN